ncbi:MAG: SDR family NAD(P)-dependent oxidoreductase [Symploca sp. SIO3C6]|nr:SDR family NAD(P)-dependent oxidoreductase [Symploca sp. SIO3C6]
MSEAKVAVVLGVGPGLGGAIVRRFARENFAVAMMARNEDMLKAIQQEVEEFGGVALPVATDATNPNSVIDAFAQVKEKLGTPEVFVYNAGTLLMGGILELTPEQFENSWKINCLGAFLAVQQVLPAMVERGSGAILLTGATASLRGGARFAGLAVGKFGLRALAQSLAREFSPQGIHVAHIIIDGLINTPRVQAMAPERESHTMLSPEAIAQTYWQLYLQEPTAWTLELDLRPAVEKF